jgi:hypothetical protein
MKWRERVWSVWYNNKPMWYTNKHLQTKWLGINNGIRAFHFKADHYFGFYFLFFICPSPPPPHLNPPPWSFCEIKPELKGRELKYNFFWISKIFNWKCIYISKTFCFGLKEGKCLTCVRVSKKCWHDMAFLRQSFFFSWFLNRCNNL